MDEICGWRGGVPPPQPPRDRKWETGFLRWGGSAFAVFVFVFAFWNAIKHAIQVQKTRVTNCCN